MHRAVARIELLPNKSAKIMEGVVIDHILRCRGDAIKIVVNDNASVAKRWLTTVAMPQYIVDQD